MSLNRHLTRITVHGAALNPSGTLKYTIFYRRYASPDGNLMMMHSLPPSVQPLFAKILIIHKTFKSSCLLELQCTSSLCPA